jgi:hypothetical protein
MFQLQHQSASGAEHDDTGSYLATSAMHTTTAAASGVPTARDALDTDAAH